MTRARANLKPLLDELERQEERLTRANDLLDQQIGTDFESRRKMWNQQSDDQKSTRAQRALRVILEEALSVNEGIESTANGRDRERARVCNLMSLLKDQVARIGGAVELVNLQSDDGNITAAQRELRVIFDDAYEAEQWMFKFVCGLYRNLET